MQLGLNLILGVAVLIGLRWLIQRESEKIMARLDAITAAQADQGTALGELATEQAQLAEQIAGLVAGSVTQEEIDEVAAQAQANADAIRAAAATADASYEPDAGEEVPPPVEEPPVEEPPIS